MQKGLIVPACKCPVCERLRKIVRGYAETIREQAELFRVASNEKKALNLSADQVRAIWENTGSQAYWMKDTVGGVGARKIQAMTDEEFEEELSYLKKRQYRQKPVTAASISLDTNGRPQLTLIQRGGKQ